MKTCLCRVHENILQNFSPSDLVLKGLEKLKTIFLASIHEHVPAAIIRFYKIPNRLLY